MSGDAPNWVKAKPHASAEKQVGDADPQSRSDVINRPAKTLWDYARLSLLLSFMIDESAAYTYDGSGRISTITLSGEFAATATFTYDDASGTNTGVPDALWKVSISYTSPQHGAKTILHTLTYTSSRLSNEAITVT